MDYAPLEHRLFADLDNERVDPDVVGLTQTDLLKRFTGESVKITEGQHIFLFMNIIDDDGGISYVLSEGDVIKNPYSFKPYKWCCRLTAAIEYIEEYEKRFKLHIANRQV
jgi:hypothetical protein